MLYRLHMWWACHRILYFIKIGLKAVNITFHVRMARHEILTDAIFEKRELTTPSAGYSITNTQNNGPKRIKSFQILFTKIGNDGVHLTRNTSLPHGCQESLYRSLMFEPLCN